MIGAAIGSTIGPGGVAAVVLPAALRRYVTMWLIHTYTRYFRIVVVCIL
jgi:hypothetical protein